MIIIYNPILWYMNPIMIYHYNHMLYIYIQYGDYMDNINDIHSVISNDIIWNLGKYMIIYILRVMTLMIIMILYIYT